MKKITLLLFVMLLVSTQDLFSAWTNLYNTGTPWKTVYLGDKLSDIFEFAINQNTSDWTVNYGIGTSIDGTGWTWRAAEWSRMDGTDNRVWKSKSNEHTFTSVGNWFYAGRFVYTSNGYTEYASDIWSENRITLSAINYISVSVLSNPSSISSSNVDAHTLDLSWTQWNAKDVMIVRYLTSGAAANSPVQGTEYVAGNMLGTGKVVYIGNSTSFSDSGLAQNTNYSYVLYSVNNNYYSNGDVIQVLTDLGTDNSKLESTLKLSGSNGKVCATFDGSAKVDLYSSSGQLMRSVNTENVFSEKVKAGLYLLRINGKTHKIVVN
jgi:hypothetical protein